MEGKKEKCHGIKVHSNFLMAQRKIPSFLMAHRKKSRGRWSVDPCAARSRRLCGGRGFDGPLNKSPYNSFSLLPLFDLYFFKGGC